MTAILTVMALWTCMTSAEVIGPRESIAYACAPPKHIAMQIEPPRPKPRMIEKAEAAAPVVKPKRIRHRGCHRHWYVNAAGRRKYRCR